MQPRATATVSCDGYFGKKLGSRQNLAQIGAFSCPAVTEVGGWSQVTRGQLPLFFSTAKPTRPGWDGHWSGSCHLHAVSGSFNKSFSLSGVFQLCFLLDLWDKRLIDLKWLTVLDIHPTETILVACMVVEMI